MTPKTASGRYAEWMYPETSLEQPSLTVCETHESGFSENASRIRALPRRMFKKSEDNNDILMPVGIRQAVLESFYDN